MLFVGPAAEDDRPRVIALVHGCDRRVGGGGGASWQLWINTLSNTEEKYSSVIMTLSKKTAKDLWTSRELQLLWISSYLFGNRQDNVEAVNPDLQI